MRFGYTIADNASISVFKRVVQILQDEMGYTPDGRQFADVDGSIRQTFQKSGDRLTVECDQQIDYVGIISDKELAIDCIARWDAD